MLFLNQAGFDLLEGASSENKLVWTQNVICVKRLACSESDIRYVARSEREVYVRHLCHDQSGSLQFKRRQEAKKLFRLGRFELEFVHKNDIAGAQAFRKGFAQRKLFGLK